MLEGSVIEKEKRRSGERRLQKAAHAMGTGASTATFWTAFDSPSTPSALACVCVCEVVDGGTEAKCSSANPSRTAGCRGEPNFGCGAVIAWVVFWEESLEFGLKQERSAPMLC